MLTVSDLDNLIAEEELEVEKKDRFKVARFNVTSVTLST